MITARSIPPWYGTVSDDGTRIDLGKAKKVYDRWLKTLAGQIVKITIEPKKKHRSLNQNGYWWAVVIPMIAERCGYTRNEHECVHDELCRVLLGLRPGHNPLNIRVSSKTLSTREFNELIEAAQIFAADKLGLVIPDPDAEYAFRKRKAPKPSPQWEAAHA